MSEQYGRVGDEHAERRVHFLFGRCRGSFAALLDTIDGATDIETIQRAAEHHRREMDTIREGCDLLYPVPGGSD